MDFGEQGEVRELVEGSDGIADNLLSDLEKLSFQRPGLALLEAQVKVPEILGKSR